MSSWEVATDLDTRIRPHRLQTARRRTGRQVGPDAWEVDGNPKFGDAHPAYHVTRGTDGRFTCSCAQHYGGEWRRTCTHSLWARLHVRGAVSGEYVETPLPGLADPVGAEEGGGVALPTPVTPPPPPVATAEPSRGVSPSRPARPITIPPDMPAWVEELRPHQTEAIGEIVEAFRSGYRRVVLDAPTGSGKTLIGDMVRRALDANAVYCCTTKTLQEQVLRDFPYARVIMGRSNYPTRDLPRAYPKISADSCNSDLRLDGGMGCRKCVDPPPTTYLHCELCHPTAEHCPYVVAKDAALKSPLAVLNTAYLLAEGNAPKGKFKDMHLVVADEADELEGALMSHVEFNVSPSMMRRLHLDPPERKTVPEAWYEWLRDDVQPSLHRLIDRTPDTTENRSDLRRLTRMRERVEKLIAPHPEGPEVLRDWIWADAPVKDKKAERVTLKPVWVDQHAGDYLWPLSRNWLLMSATVISSPQMMGDLGIESGYTTVTVPSTFPPENRPIYVEPVGDMSYKEKRDGIPRVVSRISQIIEARPVRTLIHTVSYELATAIFKALPANRRYTYRNAREREEALDQFLSHPQGILVAPSMDRGVDLAGDKCRAIIVAKVPYPYLGDRQVSARVRGGGARGRNWYTMQTIRTLVQMTGRGMRSATDSCETWILDRQFMRVWKDNRHMMPGWWKEALRMEGSDIPR